MINELNKFNGNHLTINDPSSSKEIYYNQYGLRHKSYKFSDFEDYLMTIFAEGDGSCVLDDDFPEAYDEWLGELECDDFIRYGNIYGNIKKGES